MAAQPIKGFSVALAIALAYGAFGVLWIAASDTLLAAMVSDRWLTTTLQTIKGWLFVGLSALLIYFVGTRLLRALEESERRYHLLFAASPVASALYDPVDMRLVEVNEAAADLFGRRPGELGGQAIVDLLAPDGRDDFQSQLPRLRESVPVAGMWRVRGKDGVVVDVAVNSHPVVIDGRDLRLVKLTDVTARLRAEVELLRTLDELASANEKVREISHALSHDLQEPLRQVSSFVQLLQRRYQGALDSEADQYIQFAVEGAGRLKALLGDVERFVLESPAQREMVDSAQVVAEVLDNHRGAIAQVPVEVELGLLPRLQVDRGKLAVVLHALIDNAIKFRRPDGPCRVGVAARERPDGWVFQVSDNGIGIEPEHRDTIFGLFSRLHTRDRIPGNGSGLALARKLVEAHGGRIWAESAPGGGSVFSFILPAGQWARAAEKDPQH